MTARRVRVTARTEVEYEGRAYRVGDVFETVPLEGAALARTGHVYLAPGSTAGKDVTIARGRLVRRNTYRRRGLVAESTE